MFKLIGHVVVFAVGAGAGVWYGVHHPTEAQNISANEEAKIQQAVAIAKQNLLQQVVADQQAPPAAPGTPAVAGAPATPSPTLSKYQALLSKVQIEVKDATAKTQNQ